jgi:hypothetical protein
MAHPCRHHKRKAYQHHINTNASGPQTRNSSLIWEAANVETVLLLRSPRGHMIRTSPIHWETGNDNVPTNTEAVWKDCLEIFAPLYIVAIRISHLRSLSMITSTGSLKRATCPPLAGASPAFVGSSDIVAFYYAS